MTASCVAITSPRLASITSSQSVKKLSGASATPSRDSNSYTTIFRISDVEPALADPLHHGGVAMIEEAALVQVQFGDRVYFTRTQSEAEHVEVLRDALRTDRLRDGHDAALGEPAQHDLRDRLAVTRGDRSQRLVLEDAVLSFGERRPCFELDTLRPAELLRAGLLIEGVHLYLVDRRHHLVVHDEIHEPVRLEIRNADGPDPAIAHQVLHRTPRAVDVAERLVDQIQVEIVQAETPQRTVECRFRAVE